MFSQSFMDGCDQLRTAKSEDEIKLAVQCFIENRGFWSFNLGYLDTINHAVEEAPIKFISTMNQEWTDHYTNERYDLIDFGVTELRKNKPSPILTGYEFQNKTQTLTAAEEKYLKEASEANWNTGCIIPLGPFSSDGVPPMGIGLASDLNADAFQSVWSQQSSETLVFMNYMNQMLSQSIASLLHGVKPLTVREKDCLAYLALGYRPDGIGDRLFIATVTVNTHIQSARRKLNATTNAHAVAKAIRLNLI